MRRLYKLLVVLKLVLLCIRILVATRLLSLQIKGGLALYDAPFKKLRNQLDVVKVVGPEKGRNIVVCLIHLAAFLNQILEKTPNLSNERCEHKLEKLAK